MARRAGIHAAATATAPSSETVTICDSVAALDDFRNWLIREA